MWVTQYKSSRPASPLASKPALPCSSGLPGGKVEDNPSSQTRDELEEQLLACTGRHMIRQRLDLESQLHQVEAGPTREKEAGSSSPKRRKLHPEEDPPKNARDHYTTVSTNRNGNHMVVYLAKQDMCHICKEHLLMLTGEALLSCPVCGRTKPYLDATSASTAYGEEVEFSSFSYKRSNHFQEWLNSFQAKETTEIPQDIFDRVMEELYRQRIHEPSKITTKKVREVLKDLKLRKYYEHVTQITCRLNGKKPPRMSPEQEEQCRLMFMAIQGPFEKHCPPDRKNFLSYSYCLYKFCELMAYDEFLPCFALLKGRDKLFKQDTIFRKICDELHWEFLPSV